MVKREISQLAVYSIEEETETLPLECLKKLYLEKTSEIIYVTREKRLYGIICMGEVLYGHGRNSEVKINKTFRFLKSYNLIKAHEFFQRRADINKIPVLNEDGELLGDYSRWDMLYIERNQEQLMQEKIVKKVLKPYEIVYLIEPVEKRHPDYLRLLGYLKQFEINYMVLDKEELCEKLQEKAICIFLDEDERRGMQCLYGIEPRAYDHEGCNRFRFDISVSEWCKARTTTYENLLRQIEEEERLERLGLQAPADLSYEKLDLKATVLLSALQQKGVKCFFLYANEMETTEYGKRFLKEAEERVKRIPLNQEERMWPEGEEKEAFYGELWQISDYREGIAQKEIYNAVYSFGHKKNIAGKFFNAAEGKRATCFQPDQYVGTIYLMGLCTVIGLYVEDQHTIASYLQKKLLEKGYPFRVENYGSMLRHDADIDSRLEEIGRYSKNDIVVYVSPEGMAIGIEGESFEKIFEKYQIPVQWVTDGYGHCNNQVNQLMAESILEMIGTHLSCNAANDNKNSRKIPVDIHDAMQRYVQREYLNRYFACFDSTKYETVGAIVMNCNPFSKGHRYLIEWARQKVGFLIIFAVEEDASLFPFEERFKMIKDGLDGTKNIMVVPSGRFILSRNNFQEYFTKIEDEITALNAEYDITVFADYIAKPLHITHRFAGEEPKDKITKIYNDTMKKILPQKGISFVEIPRMEIEGEVVSASKVRKYLKEEDYDGAWSLLPETTKMHLRQQLDLVK